MAPKWWARALQGKKLKGFQTETLNAMIHANKKDGVKQEVHTVVLPREEGVAWKIMELDAILDQLWSIARPNMELDAILDQLWSNARPIMEHC